MAKATATGWRLVMASRRAAFSSSVSSSANPRASAVWVALRVFKSPITMIKPAITRPTIISGRENPLERVLNFLWTSRAFVVFAPCVPYDEVVVAHEFQLEIGSY